MKKLPFVDGPRRREEAAQETIAGPVSEIGESFS
jgi:hypothetical protein